ncbi:MAG: IclR family transcriptional regulator, partial [Actinomycetota bacterium]|nr:IclR family transcriptional regulator [Actinomycetota bacterium]
ALVTALVRVRQEGFALVVDELEVGLTAVAAPIRSLRGDVVASVSVSGPSFRMTSGGTEEAVSRVRHAAAQISHRLGWAPT